MRNLRNEVRRIVQEEMDSYNTNRMLVTEIGDGSAKPYKFSKFNPNLGDYGYVKTTFKTDSGLLYEVTLSSIYKFLDVAFTANDDYAVTNRGEMYKVMSTIIAIIEPVFKKIELKGIRYSPVEKSNDGGRGRDTLYRLFINSFAKKNGLKVEFITAGGIIFAEFTDPTDKLLKVPLREKLLNPGKYKITKKDLDVIGDLDLSNTDIKALPAGLTVSGNLYLSDTNIIKLPHNLTVSKDLNLDGCASLKSLPDSLQVNGSLDLTNCTSLKSLPDGLNVERNLNLINCDSLKELPNDLQVNSDLILYGCASIKSLPNRLHVGWNLDLKNTPLAKMYSVDEIRAMIESKSGYVDKKIYT